MCLIENEAKLAAAAAVDRSVAVVMRPVEWK